MIRGLIISALLGSCSLRADPSSTVSSTPVPTESELALGYEQSPEYFEALQRGKKLTQLIQTYIRILQTRNDPVDYETIESYKDKKIIICAELISRDDPAILQVNHTTVNYLVHLSPALAHWPTDDTEIVCFARVSDIVAAKGIVKLEAIDAKIKMAD